MDHTSKRVVDLVEPNESPLQHERDDARRILRMGPADAVRGIQGSFALTAEVGRWLRMARSLDRPMPLFFSQAPEGPALIVASRIDAIRRVAAGGGSLTVQFHPSYTRWCPGTTGRSALMGRIRIRFTRKVFSSRR